MLFLPRLPAGSMLASTIVGPFIDYDSQMAVWRGPFFGKARRLGLVLRGEQQESTR
jgi:hypothetical protein